MRKLNFGCGSNIFEGWDNVDIQKSSKIYKSFDFDRFPYPLKDNYYDYVLISNVLEHIKYPEETLNEIYRSCKNKAIIKIEVPHYSNYGAYSCMQHLHFYNEDCFKIFLDTKFLINKNNKFKIIKLEVTPTKIGGLMPNFLRKKLSLFVNGLNSQIHCTYQVLK